MKTINASQKEYEVTMTVKVWARGPQEAFEIARTVWRDDKDCQRFNVEVQQKDSNNEGE
jgi:hypothetical protein